MRNQQKVIQYCYDVLLPSGRIVAELDGAIKEASDRLSIMYDATIFPWVFPTKDEMAEHLINARF